jgi:hypothetical protein
MPSPRARNNAHGASSSYASPSGDVGGRATRSARKRRYGDVSDSDASPSLVSPGKCSRFDVFAFFDYYLPCLCYQTLTLVSPFFTSWVQSLLNTLSIHFFLSFPGLLAPVVHRGVQLRLISHTTFHDKHKHIHI